MYSEERKEAIVQYLEQDGKVSVADMAEKFNTSRETIRRDLVDLESKGILTRTHGGAIIKKIRREINGTVIREAPESIRGIRNSAVKQELCKVMASYIKENDIIYIDNSTTCLYILQNIPVDMHVTILTNSLRLLTEAVRYDCTNKEFFCLGGSFNPNNLSTYNNTLLPKDNLEFYPDKCIISCAGISKQRGFTDGSFYEVTTKHKFMESSTEVFVLADSSKIGADGQFFLDHGSEVDYLITDQAFEAELLELPPNVKVVVLEP